MIPKRELIKGLKNVKLVLGNGFDLHCHLKTSYADYFLHDVQKHEGLKCWTNEFIIEARSYADFGITNYDDFWIEPRDYDRLNIWDLYFFLVSHGKEKAVGEWKWCDIESTIQDSLSEFRGASELCWPFVYELLIGRPSPLTTSDTLFVLATFVRKKSAGRSFPTINSFYDFVLEQLKVFEKSFGQYIYRQHCGGFNNGFGVIVPNNIFKIYSRRTIDDLCCIENLVSVDSFNYDSPEIEEIEPIFRNINGNINTPIFGIDSDAYKAPDDRYIFTKTNRRIELDMLGEAAGDRIPFDNVIVFGHSLNRADYSYFFALLDRIDISNLERDSRIVFAFSIYDKSKEESIRAEQGRAIFQLFQDYSVYKGNAEYPNRLLDSLTTQGKVLTFEIPNIDIARESGHAAKGG